MYVHMSLFFIFISICKQIFVNESLPRKKSHGLQTVMFSGKPNVILVYYSGKPFLHVYLV